MDFGLTEQELKFQQEVREFAETVVDKRAPQLDQNEEFPLDLVAQMGERGWMGIPFARKYGGMELSTLHYAIAVEELARICPSTSITLAAHTSLGVSPIYYFGSEEQKQRYLPELTAGKTFGAFGLTEPGAGSDAGGTRTTAVLDGDQWVINGAKNFITNAAFAKTIVFTALTSPDAGSHGISSFIVEADTPGFSVGKHERKMGLKGSNTVQLHFDQCRIPKENLLGELNQGFIQFLKILDGGRISIAAIGLGIAAGALSELVDYVKSHNKNGKPLSGIQDVQFQIADLATQLAAARHLVYHAARLKDAGKSYSQASAMAKLYAGELGTRTAAAAVKIMGVDGLTSRFRSERLFRDGKLMEIGEGTSEVQRLVIARQLLR